MTRNDVVAVTTQRNEPDWLIADLAANIAPWTVDLLVLRVPRTGPWRHEGQQNRAKREMLRAYGAAWVMFIDPDERIEDNAGKIIPDLLADTPRPRRYDPPVTFGFPLREMWTPTAYRIDGTWGNKLPRTRLFWLQDEPSYPDKPIHCGVAPFGSRAGARLLDVNMYHLKNVEPSNRIERAKAYMDADPEFRHQRAETAARNWDWMADETGIELEEIPEGRGFTPAYTRPYNFTAPA